MSLRQNFLRVLKQMSLSHDFANIPLRTDSAPLPISDSNGGSPQAIVPELVPREELPNAIGRHAWTSTASSLNIAVQLSVPTQALETSKNATPNMTGRPLETAMRDSLFAGKAPLE